MIRIITFLFITILASGQEAAELFEVRWKSEQASPPVKLTGRAAEWLPAFRASLEILPESAIVLAALSQPQVLGLPESSAQQLSPLITSRYELISKDPLFRKAGSCLNYCYSEKKPRDGFARVYCPPGHGTNTPVILFLHGYGGSFIWYQHWLAEKFKDHIIISPAYGINASTIPKAYLAECLAATEHKIGHALARSWLIGLSAGGFGAQGVYVAAPRDYRGIIVLAAYPNDRQFFSSVKPESRIGFLAGEREVFVKDGSWKTSIQALTRRNPNLTSNLVPQADHFFMLTHPDFTAKWLSEMLSK